MPKIRYKNLDITGARLEMVQQAITIIADYTAKGFNLTLRQLYYQFVSRALLPNRVQSYNRLGDVISDARLAGMIDWLSITDRTRKLRGVTSDEIPTWDSPAQIIDAVHRSYKRDLWEDQKKRIEVWIEKDALVGVIEGVCNGLRVPYFSCRGYTSQSEMWVASQRLMQHERAGQDVVILHLGDHDPSGIDMSRDIQDRLALFTGGEVEFERLALNMDQVQQYNPPPNPAKITDPRAAGYISIHGNESWELDALDPTVMADLIRDAVAQHRDEQEWTRSMVVERREKVQLKAVSDRWSEVLDKLDLVGRERRSDQRRGRRG